MDWLWATLDKENRGFIGGNEAIALMLKSGLSVDRLREVRELQ